MKKKMFLGKWLLVALLLLASIPLSIGRGKSGGGGSINCSFLEKADKLPVFITFLSDGYTRPNGCVIPFVNSNPYSPNANYTCTIRVRSQNSKCGKFYDRIYNFPNWDSTSLPFYVTVLNNENVVITATFTETCNTCMPIESGISPGKVEYIGLITVNDRASFASVPVRYSRVLICS